MRLYSCVNVLNKLLMIQTRGDKDEIWIMENFRDTSKKN